MCQVTWQSGEFIIADGVKVANQLPLKQGDYPVLPGEPNRITVEQGAEREIGVTGLKVRVMWSENMTNQRGLGRGRKRGREPRDAGSLSKLEKAKKRIFGTWNLQKVLPTP